LTDPRPPDTRSGGGGTSVLAALAALAAAAVAGCERSAPPPMLMQVVPSAAYTNGPVALTIEAPGVRPAFTVDVSRSELIVDTGSLALNLLPESAPEAPPIRLEPLRWNGADLIYASTPAGLAPARYTVELVDPRGKHAVSSTGFESLGPDSVPPSIDVRMPAQYSYLAAARPSDAVVDVDDGRGMLADVHWETASGESGACALPPEGPYAITPSKISCRFTIMAPPKQEAATPDPFFLSVWASDLGGMETMVKTPLYVARVPTIISFSGTVGSLGGRQPFVVSGRDFLPGSQAFIGGLPVIDQVRKEDSLEISGLTPPRSRAEAALVEVRSPAGTATATLPFTYLPAPNPRDVQPPRGPAAGGIRVTVRGNNLRYGVTIFLGASPEHRRMLTNPIWEPDNKVVGCLPPGNGTVSLWAHDRDTGEGVLLQAFTYDEAIAATGVAAASGDAGAGGPDDAGAAPAPCP
jgi:hypothetical protein